MPRDTSTQCVNWTCNSPIRDRPPYLCTAAASQKSVFTNTSIFQKHSIVCVKLRSQPLFSFVNKKKESLHLFCSYGDHVQHFKVLQDRCGQYYIWDETFSSLNELVEFYHSNSIAKERMVFLRDPEHFARVSTHDSFFLFCAVCQLCLVDKQWALLVCYSSNQYIEISKN